MTSVTENTQEDEEIPMHLQEKVGSKCCGCCCDYRRAVIWANCIWVGIATFLLFSRDEVVALADEIYDDDLLADEASGIVDEYYRRRSISLGISLGTAILSQLGANYCNLYLIALHMLALIADFVVFCVLAMEMYHDMQATLGKYGFIATSPLSSFLLNTLWTLLLLYPQCGFFLECWTGIMTPETLPREDYSCCCGTQKVQADPPASISPVDDSAPIGENYHDRHSIS